MTGRSPPQRVAVGGRTVAEDEAATESDADTVMTVPKTLVPAVRELIAKHLREAAAPSPGVQGSRFDDGGVAVQDFALP